MELIEILKSKRTETRQIALNFRKLERMSKRLEFGMLSFYTEEAKNNILYYLFLKREIQKIQNKENG